MSRKSRVPDMPDADRAALQFFDAIDRRQQQLADLEDVDTAATLPDVIAKLNEILETHRTK